MMNRRYEDYGYLDVLSSEMSHNQILQIELMTMFPHTKTLPHLHFTEQVLYVIRGNGYSIVDGERINTTSGEVLHWAAGVTHEMFNPGSEEFKALLIISPDLQNIVSPDLQSIDEFLDLDAGTSSVDKAEAIEYMCAAVDAFRSQLADTTYNPYMVLDVDGIVLLKAGQFPPYCHASCGESLKQDCAPCMTLCKTCYDEQTRRCPYNLTLFLVPVMMNRTFLGTVMGGFVRTRLGDCTGDMDVFLETPTALRGIQVTLHRISRILSLHCEFYKMRKDQWLQRSIIADEQRHQEELAENLRTAQTQMTDLKINNHFLFNTLNQMASMALDGGLFPLYQSIIDLSRLFRYTLQNVGNIVSLDVEASSLYAYLELQKVRYGDNLTLDYEIDTSLEKWQIPFNILMPLAENTFTHGFADTNIRHLTLRIYEEGTYLHIDIENNGPALDAEVYKMIKLKLQMSTNHGLPMIYRKLQTYYEDDFLFELRPAEGGGTVVHIKIPAMKTIGGK